MLLKMCPRVSLTNCFYKYIKIEPISVAADVVPIFYNSPCMNTLDFNFKDIKVLRY